MYYGKDDVMGYEDFIKEYGNNLKENLKDDKCINHCFEMLEYNKEYKEENYKSYIENIYIGIIHIKYLKSYDINILCKMLSSIIYLKSDYDLNHNKNFYNFDKLCEEVYKNIYNYHKNILNKINAEDFKSTNILNIEYILNNIFDKNDNNYNLLNNIIWRTI